MFVDRPDVFRSDRIRVTESMIRSRYAKNILKIGSGDFSFEGLKEEAAKWVKADLAGPCDVAYDLNREDVSLPFEDAAFDLVICTEVLEHLLWPQSLLAECFRLLSTEGSLVVSVPNAASLSYRIAWLLGRIPSCAASGNIPLSLGSTAYQSASGSLTGGHVIDFNLRRMVNLLKSAGFAIADIKGSGIIWHKQILPHWMVPVSLSSNIICLVKKNKKDLRS